VVKGKTGLYPSDFRLVTVESLESGKRALSQSELKGVAVGPEGGPEQRLSRSKERLQRDCCHGSYKATGWRLMGEGTR
jgi:hypothetical protein